MYIQGPLADWTYGKKGHCMDKEAMYSTGLVKWMAGTFKGLVALFTTSIVYPEGGRALPTDWSALCSKVRS